MAEDRNSSFNDAAVSTPEHDAFGIAPFAAAIATAFVAMKSPVGATIGLNGPWGSGKTSAVNLIRHYLRSEVEQERLGIVDFRCWWFKGDEALTLAFLQELRGALEAKLGGRTKDLFGRIGRKLLQAGPIVGPAVNLATGGLWGAFAGGATDIANKFLTEADSLETVMEELAALLRSQNKRYLVVIDDIDRLTPDEALQVFRLIKSVGRLPNVMYLAVFDRQLAEKAAQERYPSEGPHFLEKIVQASFELPLPDRNDLNSALLREVETICGVPVEQKMQRFWNTFYDAVAPFITLPRHVVRLANSMTVTWPSIKGEVDIADYVALESLRLSEPRIYNAIRLRKGELVGVSHDRYGGRDNINKVIEELENTATLQNRSFVKAALQRLFPRLEGVGYSNDYLSEWDAERRVCSERHFPKYFRLSLGDGVLSAADIDIILQRANDPEFISSRLREAAKTVRRNGQSDVPIILEELNVHARAVAPEHVRPLISTLFVLVDEIDLARDEDRSSGFGIDSELRLHWLIRRLTNGLNLAQRSEIYMSAAEGAPVGWLADFFSSAYRDYHPQEDSNPAREDDCLVQQDQLEALRRMFLNAVRQAASTGVLLSHRKLSYILFRWYDFGEDGGAEVRAWSAKTIEEDRGVAVLAASFTSETWSQGIGMFGLGDRVAKKMPRASVSGLEKLLDLTLFRRRLEQLAAAPATLSVEEQSQVRVFLDAWRSAEAGGGED